MQIQSTYNEKILSSLQSIWENIQQQKQFECVLLEGISGIGKTEIVEDFISMNSIHAIRCRGAVFPVVFWKSMLESIMRLELLQECKSLSPENLSLDFQDIMSGLAHLHYRLGLNWQGEWNILGNWLEQEQVSLQDGDFGEVDHTLSLDLVNGFAYLISKLSLQQPIVIFIDNFDISANTLLDDLGLNFLKILQEHQILIILVSRKNNVVEQEFLQSLMATVPVHFLEIPPLDEEKIFELLTQLYDSERLDLKSWAAKLYEAEYRTVYQVRDAVSQIQMSIETQQEVIKDIPSPQALLNKIFGLFDKTEQDILRLASVQGMLFSIEIVALILNEQVDFVMEKIRNIRKSPSFILSQNPTMLHDLTWFQFSSEYIREFIYQSINGNQREQYHLDMVFPRS